MSSAQLFFLWKHPSYYCKRAIVLRSNFFPFSFIFKLCIVLMYIPGYISCNFLSACFYLPSLDRFVIILYEVGFLLVYLRLRSKVSGMGDCKILVIEKLFYYHNINCTYIKVREPIGWRTLRFWSFSFFSFPALFAI